MIVCKQCGHRNEDSDTFCGSCGRFLEWTGERVAVPEAPPPAPEAEPEPARVGLIERVRQAVFLDDPTPVPAAAPVTPEEPVAAGATAPVPVAASAAPPQATVAEEPASRLPTAAATAPARRPRTYEAPTRRQPGDLICGQCGDGNEPSRHFCRRCGNGLDEALAVRLPWYRRWFGWLFRQRIRQAGWRPKGVGSLGIVRAIFYWLRVVVGLAIIIFLLLFILVPSFRSTVITRASAAFTTVRRAVHPNYDPVHAVAAAATSSIAGHGPLLAIDGFNNTYWAASPRDTHPVLMLTFARPVDLAQVIFTSGASGTAPADSFALQPRPMLVHLVFSNGYTIDLTLKDDGKPQGYLIDARQILSVEVHVQTVYQPVQGQVISAVAITEAEFRTKD